MRMICTYSAVVALVLGASGPAGVQSVFPDPGGAVVVEGPVVPGDPSSDIRVLSDVELVFRDGVRYSPKRLRASARGKVGWH